MTPKESNENLIALFQETNAKCKELYKVAYEAMTEGKLNDTQIFALMALERSIKAMDKIEHDDSSRD